VLLSGACRSAKQSYYYSPAGAMVTGPGGPAKKISIKPYCCPATTAIEIRSKKGASDTDAQWVRIPLSVPGGKIKSVSLCYSIKTSGPGKTFISQMQLTKMTIPNSTVILYDDDTNLVSTAPDCYTVKTNAVADGTVTLALRVNIKRSDAIYIGGIALEVQQKGPGSNFPPINIEGLLKNIMENKIKKVIHQ